MKNFITALAAIKAVGYEAISNIVNERIKNGKFKSINDFIKRVNPKDINKLQLEGLIKAGAFDTICTNRKSIFNSVPSLISKAKFFFDNKIVNQNNLFVDEDYFENEIIENIEDWNFEERLSKEFESIGFFISDHPLNQFKDIFDDYKIIDYNKFNSSEDIIATNIAATLLKIQERKTGKGNSYAVLKLTDLTSVFELFIFSEVLEKNRQLLVEGDSFILTLAKTSSADNNRLRRINVQKIASLKELLNNPINEVTFELRSSSQLNEIYEILTKDGNTKINIELKENNQNFIFHLKNNRNLDRKLINLLRNKEIYAKIN